MVGNKCPTQTKYATNQGKQPSLFEGNKMVFNVDYKRRHAHRQKGN